MKSLKNYLTHIIEVLEKASYKKPIAQEAAWWIIEYITQKSKAIIIGSNTLKLTLQQEEKLALVMNQIQKDMPLAYIFGHIPFGHLNLLIEPPVLIPRPETEEWSYWLIDELKIYKEPLSILDLCTGSGCIALALAQQYPQSHATGIDIKQQAIELAKKNAIKNSIHNVTFLHSDLYSALNNQSFDLIVSNPPYISFAEWENLEASVKEWEDAQALQAHDDGYEIIKKIIDQAKKYLHNNKKYATKKLPRLIIEVGYLQASTVADYMKDAGFETIIKKDAQGHERVVVGYASI